MIAKKNGQGIRKIKIKFSSKNNQSFNLNKYLNSKRQKRGKFKEQK
jgi:hypothetical protein